MDFPSIVNRVVEQAWTTYKPSKFMLDPYWVCCKLYNYQQSPELDPRAETDQDCVWAAEKMLPRHLWNITESDYIRSSAVLSKSNRAEYRHKRIKQIERLNKSRQEEKK